MSARLSATDRRIDELRADMSARFAAIDQRLGGLDAAIRASTRSLIATMVALFAVAVPVWTAASAFLVRFLIPLK
jgi:hypothetical protein